MVTEGAGISHRAFRVALTAIALGLARGASASTQSPDAAPGSRIPVAVVSHDEAAPAGDSEPPRIARIRFHGLRRTSVSVVERELTLAEGGPLEGRDLDESVRRLKNLLLFSKVEPSIATDADGQAVIDLNVTEKWTTIPILRFGGGGGSTYAVVGAYDINVLGRYLETGAQYEYLDGTSSGVVWFRNPRLFGQHLRLGADFWDATRVRSLYDDNALSGAFTLRRRKANLFLDREVAPGFVAGLGAELDSDSFSDDHQTAAQRAANAAGGFVRPPDGVTALGRVSLLLGHLDFDDYLVSGRTVSATWEHSPRVSGVDFPLDRGTVDARAYARLPFHSNLAGRLTLGWTDSEAVQHLFYIGGLDYTRGLLDGQARGTQVWNGNLEIRVPSVRSDWLVLQHVAFTDFGNIAYDTKTLLGYRNVLCTSSGVGVRIISPRIYRFVLRVDYAVAFGPHKERGVSFGVQQFF